MIIECVRHPNGAFTITSEHLEGNIFPDPVYNRCYVAEWLFYEPIDANSRKIYTNAMPNRSIPRKELFAFLRTMRKCMDQLLDEECGIFMTPELDDHQAESRLSLYLRAGFKPARACFREFGSHQYWGREYV